VAFKLGLDAKRAFNNHSGLGVYSRSLIEYLEKNIPNLDIILFTPKKKIWTSSLLTVTNIFGALWRTFFIYFDLVKYKIDVYHGLAGELPFFIPSSVKKVVTIHDLLFLQFPNDYPWIDRLIYNIKAKYACKHADSIIAVSEVTKKNIIDFYNISPEKISVIPNTAPILPNFSDEKPHPQDYIICISSFLGRKNQDILVKAFERIADQVSFDLIFIGSGKRLAEIKNLASNSKYNSRIKFLTGLNDSKKTNYLKHCLFSVYPSQGEGFGIPILESFQMNKPIILSDTPIHREVAADGGLYFILNSIEDLAEKMIKVNTGTLQYPIEKAQSRLNSFEGSNLYPQIADIYYSLMGLTPRI
jgi:glycosyltransferase involved in cell wall biosynthesis